MKPWNLCSERPKVCLQAILADCTELSEQSPIMNGQLTGEHRAVLSSPVTSFIQDALSSAVRSQHNVTWVWCKMMLPCS